LFTRILRYFFQQGLLEGLEWSENPTASKIYIEDSFAEIPKGQNPWPSVVISIGGAQINPISIGNSLTSQSLTDRTKGMDSATTISMEIIGRNKSETFKISDAIATVLYLFSPEIKQYAVDIEDLLNITVGAVSPVNQVGAMGDQILTFTSSVTLSVRYKIEYKIKQNAIPFNMAVFSVRSEDNVVEGAEVIYETIQIPESEYGKTGLPDSETPASIAGDGGDTVLVGASYSFTPVITNPSGKAYNCVIENKPYWATFNTSTGVLTGTPTTGDQGKYGSIRIGIQQRGNVVGWTDHFTILVTKLPVIVGTPPTTGKVGNLYEFVPTMYDPNGLNVTANITNKPPWASFDSTTGRLYGTPAAPGTHTGIVIKVTNVIGLTAELPVFSIGVVS